VKILSAVVVLACSLMFLGCGNEDDIAGTSDQPNISKISKMSAEERLQHSPNPLFEAIFEETYWKKTLNWWAL